jgi:hypothetical protein
MYGWGKKDDVEKVYENVNFFDSGNAGYGSVRCGNLMMYNFNGDCGALLMSGCNNASYEDIKAAQKIASTTGHSKLFGTIVCKEEYAQRAAALFKKAGFRLIKKTKSNRNPEKTDITVFYHNPNCIKTGY